MREEEWNKAKTVVGNEAAVTHINQEGGIWSFLWLGQCSCFCLCSDAKMERSCFSLDQSWTRSQNGSVWGQCSMKLVYVHREDTMWARAPAQLPNGRRWEFQNLKDSKRDRKDSNLVCHFLFISWFNSEIICCDSERYWVSFSFPHTGTSKPQTAVGRRFKMA